MAIRVLELERIAATPREAAALIGRSERTIRRLLKRGDPAYSRIGSDIVIEVEEMSSFLSLICSHTLLHQATRQRERLDL